MIWLYLFSAALSAQELPFPQALQQMLEQNVSVQVQQTKVEASNFQLNAARGAFTPQIYLLAQQQNSGGNAPNPTGSSQYATSQLYTANAAWNLFHSGADMAGVHAATVDRSVQLSLLADTTLQAEDKSARALLAMVERAQIVQALQRSEDSVNHFLEIATARFERSLLSREETDKVMLDAANAEARRADAELELNGARADVIALLGHSRVTLDWPWVAQLSNDRVKSLLTEKDATLALKQRPDYRAAQDSVEREDTRGRSLFRNMLPSIDFTYSVGDTHTMGQTIFGWSSLATLTIPLWNGLRDYSAYRVQVENKFATEHQLAQLQRDVQSRVQAAQSNFVVAFKQYEDRTRNLKVAHHIMDQDGARFKVGRADANELNLDLTRVTAAEILTIQGIEQVHVAYMDLLHAFGQRL